MTLSIKGPRSHVQSSGPCKENASSSFLGIVVMGGNQPFEFGMVCLRYLIILRRLAPREAGLEMIPNPQFF